MSPAWHTTTRHASCTDPAGPPWRRARRLGLAVSVWACVLAGSPAQATLKVVPESRKPPAATPAAPAPPASAPAPVKEPAARESAPKDGGRESGRRDPVAKDHGGKDSGGKDSGGKDHGGKDATVREGGGREPAGTRPRVPEAARAACSDELVALSLGTLGPDEIERLRTKGCLPAAASK